MSILTSILRRARFTFRHPLIAVKYLVTHDTEALRVAQIQDLMEAYRKATGLPSGLEELQEYLGLSRSVVALNMVRSTELIARRWREEDPGMPEHVRAFYENCSEYLYELALWNTHWRYEQLLALFDGEGGGRCLSFGGGIGTEALRLAAQGNEVWYCDIPGSPVWKFAQWRARRWNVPIHFTADVPQAATFDCVVAFDVFEHLTEADLEVAIRNIAAALKPGGRLYCNNAFGFGESTTHPLHYDHRQLWDRILSALPLRKVDEEMYVKREPA